MAGSYHEDKSKLVKTVKDSMVTTVHLLRPADLNCFGRLFGGMLMQWIDETAGIVALRHCETTVTTACVDKLTFLRGAYDNDRVVLVGKAVYVGNTSMVVKVETFVEKMDRNKESRDCINEAYLTLVGLDDNDKPVRIPRLQPETPEEIAEFERIKELKSLMGR